MKKIIALFPFPRRGETCRKGDFNLPDRETVLLRAFLFPESPGEDLPYSVPLPQASFPNTCKY